MIPRRWQPRLRGRSKGRPGCTSLRFVIAEAARVLRKVCGVPREIIVDTLCELLQRESLVAHDVDTSLVVTGLQLARACGRASVPDALLRAAARAAAPALVFTFDRRFPAQGVECRPPGPHGRAAAGQSSSAG